MRGILYILKSKKVDKYYIGSTNNLNRRFNEHNLKKKRYTSKYAPWIIVYTEHFSVLSDARTREKQIKKWKSKKMIDKLISGVVSSAW